MQDRWGDKPVLKVKNKNIWWELELELEGNKFEVDIVYPDDYPDSAPIIEIYNIPSNCPHSMAIGNVEDRRRVCWHYEGSSRNNNLWNPASDTAALCVGVTYRWCLSYIVWKTTGYWPIPDAKND